MTSSAAGPAGDSLRPPQPELHGNMTSDVTVVIPAYNAESTLTESVNSIKAQTRPPVRIVIADDQSPDGSAALARSLGLPNLEVVTLPTNQGCGGARNFGAHGATTKYLAFLDADDTWAPTFLEEVVGAIESKQAGFGASGGIRELAYRGTTSRRLLDGPAVAVDLTDSFWRNALRFMPIHPSSIVIRRDLFEAAGGFCGVVRNGEDTPLWAELWRRSRFVFVNKPLFTSVAPAGGVSASPIAYSDIRISLGRVGGSLVKSIAARKRGSGWFAVWFGATVVRRHALWVVRHVRRMARGISARRHVPAHM